MALKRVFLSAFRNPYGITKLIHCDVFTLTALSESRNISLFKPNWDMFEDTWKPKTADKQTVSDIRKKLMNWMQVSSVYQYERADRSHLDNMLPISQDELPERSMRDSYDVAYIPLTDNNILQNRYTNVLHTVRLGRLMEDMDIFAAWIASIHILNPKQDPASPTPYTIVTGLVDQMTFSEKRLSAKKDIKLSGYMSWVGKSSMEITVHVEQENDGIWEKATTAYFVMVARNPNNTKAAFVNKLIPSENDEKKLFEKAQKRMATRKLEADTSLMKKAPDTEEQQTIHDIFMKSVDTDDPTLNRRILPSNSVWMEQTRMTNTVFPHPEDRNYHNKIFGGFLMRMATELGWMIGYYHCKDRPYLMHVSDIVFKHGVPVGAFLKMFGEVVYTENEFMHIVVRSDIEDVITGDVITTNIFYYTFKAPVKVKSVIPYSYNDFMAYLYGRRHYQKFILSLESDVKIRDDSFFDKIIK